MYLYLPQQGFRASAQVLDDDTLWGQLDAAEAVLMACVHAHQHGALATTKLLSVQMWRGYEAYLLTYVNALCVEWGLRWEWQGDPSNPLDNPYVRCYNLLRRNDINRSYAAPKWIGLRAIRESHRSALLAHDPGHYGQHFPTTPVDMPYVWPVNTLGHFDYTLQVSKLHAEQLHTGEMVLPAAYAKGVIVP